VCSGSVLGHYWLVDSIEIALAFPTFFERHRDAPAGWVWVVCAHCAYPYQAQVERAPTARRARFCVTCFRALRPGTHPNSRPKKCWVCSHESGLLRDTRFRDRNRERLRMQDRERKARKRAERKAAA